MYTQMCVEDFEWRQKKDDTLRGKYRIVYVASGYAFDDAVAYRAHGRYICLSLKVWKHIFSHSVTRKQWLYYLCEQRWVAQLYDGFPVLYTCFAPASSSHLFVIKYLFSINDDFIHFIIFKLRAHHFLFVLPAFAARSLYWCMMGGILLYILMRMYIYKKVMILFEY